MAGAAPAPRRGAGPAPLITATGGGTRLVVHVQPRAVRTEVAGPHGDALRIRLAAPPVDGAANEALVAFVAARCGLPARAVTLVHGHHGRRKVLELAGVTPDRVREALLG